jgi:hypothetical protein
LSGRMHGSACRHGGPVPRAPTVSESAQN